MSHPSKPATFYLTFEKKKKKVASIFIKSFICFRSFHKILRKHHYQLEANRDCLGVLREKTADFGVIH